MLEMNAEIRSKWTAALRSGDFEQGIECLGYNDPDDGDKRKNCCMGVLCELAVEAGVLTSVLILDTVFYGAEVENRTLPDEVIAWAGLSDTNPVLRPYQPSDQYYRHLFGRPSEVGMTCADANDGERLNFLEIADLIDGGENAGS
jgi:hypothetical protein